MDFISGLAIIFAFEMFRKDIVAPLMFMVVVGGVSLIVDVLLCIFGGRKETGKSISIYRVRGKS